MEYVEQQGLDSVISWIMGGSAFKIHDPEKIVSLLPLFFGQTKYRSLHRQINMWHFEKILDGPNKGGYFHSYFVKGNRALCSKMSRNLIHKPESSGNLKTFSKLKMSENFMDKQPLTSDKMMTFSELMQNLDNRQSSCNDESDVCAVALHAAENIISRGNNNNNHAENVPSSAAIDLEDIYNNGLNDFAGRSFFSIDYMEQKSQHLNHTAQALPIDLNMKSEFQFLASSFYPTEMKNSTALDGVGWCPPPRRADHLAFPFDSMWTDVERGTYNELWADDDASLLYPVVI